MGPIGVDSRVIEKPKLQSRKILLGDVRPACLTGHFACLFAPAETARITFRRPTLLAALYLLDVTWCLCYVVCRKPYRQIIDELIKNTVLCRNDFDHKILLLLDALWERNRLQDACSHVKKVVEVLPRDKVTHWRGYLHKLLRNFDEDAYHDVKGTLAAANAEKLPWIQEKPPASGDSLRVCAAEFQPGQLAWSGAIGKNEYVAVATHRLCADAPEFDPSQSTWAPRAVEKAGSVTVRRFRCKGQAKTYPV
ncbi:unnamed protein product [Symbiodinium sp. CCMP2456]|nr:unnamed protein product [Symbiodinium sp. CCMP2456]